MAKEFDIYLRNRLTECDLLVYSIPYRDGISATNQLILEAALSGCLLRMDAVAQTRLEVTSHINKLIKTCLEQLNMNTRLGTNADFKLRSILYPDTSQIIINTQTLRALAQVFGEAENNLVLSAQPLTTQILSSIGRGKLPLPINSSIIGTSKYSLLNLQNTAIPDALITQFTQVNHLDIDFPIVVDSTLQSLCYQLAFEASERLEIMALVLGTGIRHSLGRWYDGIVLNSHVMQTVAHKFIAVQSVAAISQNATAKLVHVLYPDEVPIFIDVSPTDIVKKRSRLLKEMNPHELCIYDDMPLDDVDYVIL